MTQAPKHNQFSAPAHNWADGSSRGREGTSWVPAMLVGALIFAVGCGSGLLVGWIGGTVSGLGSFMNDMDFGPANITITTDTPQAVTVGEPITVTVSITDTSSEDRTIQDIDWEGSIVDNFTFGPVNPAPIDENPDDNYREVVFNTPLSADQTKDFSFTITPNQPGIYNAEITVYVDDYNSEWTNISIDVQAAP